MRLYNSLGPNPRLVRMFLCEKGIQLPTVEIDLLAGENRRPPYTDANPAGQMPSLELEDGRVLSETVAICEYLEELHPAPPLIGATPQERAETRMWQRRIELAITEKLYDAFRFAEGRSLFEKRIRVIPEAAEGLKATVRDKLRWLENLLGNKEYVVGKRFTLADIVLFVALEFGSTVGQPIEPNLPRIGVWLARMRARPSAAASLHPAAVAAGMKG